MSKTEESYGKTQKEGPWEFIHLFIFFKTS